MDVGYYFTGQMFHLHIHSPLPAQNTGHLAVRKEWGAEIAVPTPQLNHMDEQAQLNTDGEMSEADLDWWQQSDEAESAQIEYDAWRAESAQRDYEQHLRTRAAAAPLARLHPVMAQALAPFFSVGESDAEYSDRVSNFMDPNGKAAA